MTWSNPHCPHRTKRKLRPLVLSLAPQGDAAAGRRAHVTRMFATHPSLAAIDSPISIQNVQCSISMCVSTLKSCKLQYHTHPNQKI